MCVVVIIIIMSINQSIVTCRRLYQLFGVSRACSHIVFRCVATVALERIWKWGRRMSRTKFWSYPLHFLALRVQVVFLVSAFVMDSTVWSVYCLLCSTHSSPRAQPFNVKMGARAPVPYLCSSYISGTSPSSLLAECRRSLLSNVQNANSLQRVNYARKIQTVLWLAT